MSRFGPSAVANLYLSRGLGAILVVAGLLKLVSGGPLESSAVTSLVPIWVLDLVPLYEIGFGLWLSSGVWRYGFWLLALVTLGLFTLHNLELLAVGRASCGCLGAGGPSPGWMLGFDVLAGGLLLKRRPGWAGWPADTPALRTAGLTAGVTAGVVGLAYLATVAGYGSVAAALADSRGDALVLLPARIDAGLADPETTVERTVQIQNLTAEPVQVSLVRVNCSCAEFDGLPLDLAPGGRGRVAVRVRTPAGGGRYTRAGLFRSTVGDVRFEITGWAREATPPAASSAVVTVGTASGPTQEGQR